MRTSTRSPHLRIFARQSRARKTSTGARPLEIEMKFKLSEEVKKKISSLDGVKFLSQKRFTDIYYDSEGYSITCRDVWLRQRKSEASTSWEMKIPINFESRVSKNSIERVRNQIRTSSVLKLCAAKNRSILRNKLNSRYRSLFASGGARERNGLGFRY